MLGVILAFIATGLFSVANIIDSHLSNKVVRDPVALVLYQLVLSLIFIPFITFFGPVAIPSFSALVMLAGAGVLQVAYLIPYFKAFQQDDTSVAMSLFALGQVFVPILAFLILGEHLSLVGYVGIALIIVSSFAITHKRRLHFGPVLTTMALSALLLALLDILLKHAVGVIPWTTVVFWMSAFSAITILIYVRFVCWSVVKKALPRVRKNIVIILVNQIASFSGYTLMIYAFSLIPVTLAKGIDGTKPLFILVIALVCAPVLPRIFQEDVRMQTLLKKAVFYVIMIVGIILLVS